LTEQLSSRKESIIYSIEIDGVHISQDEVKNLIDKLRRDVEMKATKTGADSTLQFKLDKSNVEVSKLVKHNLELEKLVTDQDSYMQTQRSSHSQQTHTLRQQIQEFEIVIQDYEKTNDALKGKLHHSTFMKNEESYTEEIASLKSSLQLSETHVQKLQTQYYQINYTYERLEVGDITRKAVHENTLQMLKKAQEDSSSITLQQHERALSFLSSQTNSQSTKIFDTEVKRLVAHLSRAENNNETLRAKINELEAESYKLKNEIPGLKDIDALRKNLSVAVFEREKVEQQIDAMKENLTFDERGILNLFDKIRIIEDEHDGGVSEKKFKKLEKSYATMLESKNDEIRSFKVEMDQIIQEIRLLSS